MMSASEPEIQVAVIGVGRMGKHHARTYAKMDGVKLVAVVDENADRRGTVADEYGCEDLATVEDLLNQYPQLHAVTIAVPTVSHYRIASELIRAGVACLIEKPLAQNTDEARQIVELSQQAGSLVQVGHTERYNPVVQSVMQMRITPRFMEVDRISPMTFRSLDVGVVMDMMIHDLDIVLALAGSPLRSVQAAGVAVLGEHEDVANARLIFENGCVANLTASRLALKTERKLRIFSEDAYVSLDYQKRTGLVINKTDNADALGRVRKQVAEGTDLSDLDYSDLLNIEELNMDHPDGVDQLTAQARSFLDAVVTGRKPDVDARAGFDAVDAAQRVVAAVREHQWEGLAQPRV